jgi:DtxR family Mn-dependent transcriptional regulator
LDNPVDKLSTTVEDYLSWIYVLERDHEPVTGVRLAELLGVTPPTVTNTLKRLARDGLIRIDKEGTRLTKAGRESAQTVTRRHMLTEWMMLNRLPWSRLHLEAHNLEHAISAEAENALLGELSGKETCPHGNPLPGHEQAVAGWVRLTELAAGQSVIVRRIHELAEQNVDLMAFLEANGIMPGARVRVTEVLPFNETVALEVKGNPVTLGFATARYVFVERGGSKCHAVV